jgi:hypothetical protein
MTFIMSDFYQNRRRGRKIVVRIIGAGLDGVGGVLGRLTTFAADMEPPDIFPTELLAPQHRAFILPGSQGHLQQSGKPDPLTGATAE